MQRPTQTELGFSVSVYGGSGFVGSKFLETTSCSESVGRESNDCMHENVLYLIANRSTHNYSVLNDPYLDINTNLIKLISVLDCYRKSNKRGVFNFVSSWFVYGKNCTLDTKETDCCDPMGFYSITKRTAEQLLSSYCETHGINYRIFRLTNMIGREDASSKKRNALQYMISMMKENKDVQLHEGGEFHRDYMMVDDACEAMRVCMKHSPTNEIINISDSRSITIRSAVEYARSRMGSSSNIVSVPTPTFDKTFQIKNVCLNNKKLVSFGYVTRRTTEQMIDSLLT